ncbi:hypothetical protein HYT00_03430 [Candidatus Giovannonibacteria bacterium]|nr:hypothetical protein [Candidatus Giovannonibacteria bacterium]
MDPTAMHGISLTPGTKSFSVRFISQTKYEIWNDETETKENCEGCWELPLFPTYYETSFLFILGADTFQSASHHIIENPAPPPVKNSTLPVPEECAPSRFSKVSAIGYFFDKYEKAEYMKGLLVYHFRLLPPRNYGQNWYMNFSLFDKDCYYGADYGHGLTPENFYSTSIKPWSRYYSVRFTSPTHYEIWNDETETKETCASCSKDIPSILPNGSEAKFFTVRFSVPGGMGGDSFFSSSYFSIEEPKPKQNPVLIIPGMIGSELYNEDDFIWMDKGQIASDIRDDFLKQLNLDSNGHSINSISVGNLIDEININIPALGRILILDIFKGLIKDFKSNGYVVNKSYFVFPYDWRINLDRSIESLRQKINEIKSETGSNKVE